MERGRPTLVAQSFEDPSFGDPRQATPAGLNRKAVATATTRQCRSGGLGIR